MNILLTGCAGFIGSNFIDNLLSRNNKIIGIDNLSTGNIRFLSNSLNNKNFQFHQNDLLDLNYIKPLFKNIDIVYHFAANADVRFGLDHPKKDLEQNTIVTFNVLEAMRANNVNKIVFSSTGSVYGEAKEFPTPEDAAFPIQTSLYGASKVACESLIQAYCEGYGIQSWIFRFVSILGPRYSHGHVFDFYKKLKNDSKNLNVLGNGTQKKSYLHINDCIEAISLAQNYSNDKVNIFNLGVNDYCEVNDSISWICDELNINPKLIYSGGDRGWVGDNPFIFLDTKKILSTGWKPKYSIKDGVLDTLSYIKNNEWILNRNE